MIKNASKKLLSLVLALCLMASLVSIAIPAAAVVVGPPVISGIKTATDDMEEYTSGSKLREVDGNSSDLEIAVVEGQSQIIGLRFADLEIPIGATVTSAYIQFTVDEATNNDPFDINIYADNSADSQTFAVSDGSVSSRSLTTASVNWKLTKEQTWADIDTAGLLQRTPDVSTLVQTIIDKDAWASSQGKAVTFIMSGTGARVARSYESAPAKAAVLNLTYTTTATSNQDQAAPANLNSIAPTTVANSDGQITGTSNLMEYKLSSGSTWKSCTETPITGLSAGTYDVRYAAKVGFNASLATTVTVSAFVPVIPANPTLIEKNSTWKYNDSNTDLGTTWRAAAYDDSAWKTGEGPLGYPIGDSNPTFGALSANNGTIVANLPKGSAYITYYYRNTFNLTTDILAGITKLDLTLGIDDGYVMYINGTEVRRDYMPAATEGEITWQTCAIYVNEPSSTEGTVTADITASALTLLTAGTNTIAVEVHNRDHDSSDIYFDMQLIGTNGQSNQDQIAPTGFICVAPTKAANNDGQITRTSNLMEYKLSSGSTWTSCGAAVTGLAAGTYDVRYAAKTGFNASPATTVIVPAFTDGTAPIYTYENITLQPGINESVMNFCWYTGTDMTTSSIKLAKATDLADGTLPTGASVFAGTVSLSIGGVSKTNEVTVTGLEPSTVYAYQLGNGTSYSPVFTFKTQNSTSYNALFVGDPQIGSSGSNVNDTAGWAATVTAATTKFPESSFILSAGDQVETSTSESQYDGFFSPAALTSLPLVPTIGNHDNGALYPYHYNSPNESATYGTTTAGGDYWFEYGNTLYMVINSNNTSSTTHEAFIGSAITAAGNNIKWRVVMLHHSVYSSASHSDDSDILLRRSGLYPVFDAYDIDVVLMGHDHCYTRSYQLKNSTAVTGLDYNTNGDVVNPDGTLYITANSGSGSKYYDFESNDATYSSKRWQGKTPSYSNIEITDTTFTITTYRSDDGSVIDTYTIIKGDYTGPMQTNFTYLTQTLNAEIGTTRANPVYTLKSTEYTPESWNTFVSAVEAGIAMEAKTTATQTEVDGIRTAIITAKATLAPLNYGAITPYFETLQPGSNATMMNFNWVTPTSKGNGYVQISKTSEMANWYTFGTETTTVHGTVTPLASDIFANMVSVSNLEPSTQYSYRFGSGPDHSKVYTFTTGDPNSYSAILVGDPQIGASGNSANDAASWSETVTKAIEKCGNASFILSVGDQVDKADSTTQYLDFFSPEELSKMPLAPTIGNHDNNVIYNYLFNVPNESALGATDAGGDYWFTYGSTLYMVLNSNNKSATAHEEFMNAAIIAAGGGITWKVVMFHHSIYSSASHSDDDDILSRRAALYPVFDSCNIDVVLMGHDHCYTRSFIMENGEAKTDLLQGENANVINPDGTLYITANSATGSKYYDFESNDATYSALRWQGLTPSYSEVKVTANTFTITTYRTDNGAVIDTYTIYKGASDIADIDMTADKTTLTSSSSDSIQLTLTVEDNAGASLDLTGTSITYETSPSGILAASSGGKLTLADTTAADQMITVRAKLTYEGLAYVSEPLTIQLLAGKVASSINTGTDDMEELVTGGDVDVGSSDLELCQENPSNIAEPEDQLIGLRFTGLTIPAGARITGAYIQFTADGGDTKKSTNPLDIKIYAENSINTATFKNTSNTVSSRLTTTDFVRWYTNNADDNWKVGDEAGAKQRTADISSLVQYLVDKEGWTPGNAMTFIMKGTGNRTAHSFEGKSSAAAKLYITYDFESWKVADARDALADKIASGKYTDATVLAAQDVVDNVDAAFAAGTSKENEAALLAEIKAASDNLVLINQAKLTVSPNTILGVDGSITFSVAVDQLQDVSAMEGYIKLSDSDSRFEITNITPMYSGTNVLFMKNLDYSGDKTTAYFSLAKVGGFADMASLKVVDITIKLKAGVTLDPKASKEENTLAAALDSITMYFADAEHHTSVEVFSAVVGTGEASTVIWIPSEVQGDFNGNKGVSIADLAIAMTYYGAKNTDSNWFDSGAWRVDLIVDGVIDIEDLTTEAWIAAGRPTIIV